MTSFEEDFQARTEAVEAEYQAGKAAAEKMIPGFWDKVREAVEER